ncbi:MAG: hypothetical protein WCK18_05990 [Prolixibacteraceae bacterium]
MQLNYLASSRLSHMLSILAARSWAFRPIDKFCRLITMIVVMAFFSSFAEAQDMPDAIVHQRIDFLQKSISNDQKGTIQWWYGWLAGYSVLTAGQGAVWYSSQETTLRQDMATGAATTFLGLIGQFVSTYQPQHFAVKFSQLPEGTSAERLSKMTQMEKFLTDRSALEIESRKWKAHLPSLGVNLASGLVTWIGFHRTVWDGVANFALNCVISESQIWTQPLRAKKELKRYHERFGGNESVGIDRREINYNFIVSAGGAGIRIVF